MTQRFEHYSPAHYDNAPRGQWPGRAAVHFAQQLQVETVEPQPNPEPAAPSQGE